MRIMQDKQRCRQAGETIIEVMLSVVILGFTMITIFVIARESLSTGQAANERSQVQAMVETQLERMKFLSEKDSPPANLNIFRNDGVPFCVTDAIEVTTDLSFPGPCYDNSFVNNSDLRIGIVHDEEGPNASSPFDNNTFTVTANWTRVNDSSTEQLVKAYRLHNQVLPADPDLSCGESPTINITDNLGTIGGDITSFDLWYQPPQYSSPTTLDLTATERPFTNPDYPVALSDGLYIDSRCTYDLSYEMWCTAPVRSGSVFVQRPACFGGDQDDERLRVRFYENISGSPGNYQCQPPLLTYFDTADSSTGATDLDWTGSGLITGSDVLSNGFARCVDAVHVCELFPFESPPTDITCNSSSSVHLHELSWTVRD